MKLHGDLLLDTHALIWLKHQPEKLTRHQRDTLRRVESHGGIVAISAITLWEIAMLVSRGRIDPVDPLSLFLSEIEENSSVKILPLNAAVAAESVSLPPGFHADPADRLIVATARVYRIPLLTADERIRSSGAVKVI